MVQEIGQQFLLGSRQQCAARGTYCYEYVKVNVKLTLEQARKAQRGGAQVQQYSFFNFGARWSGWSTPRPGCFTPGKDPVPIV